jgi:hypothetical protein
MREERIKNIIIKRFALRVCVCVYILLILIRMCVYYIHAKTFIITYF